MAAPAPQTTGRLFAVCPDVAELLAVVALRESALGSICLHPDNNVAEAWQMEDFLGFCRSRQCNEEKRQVCYFGILWRGPTGGRLLLDADNVEAEAHQPVTNISRWGVLREVVYHHLYGLFGFRVEGEKGEVISFEVGFYCMEVHHAPCDDSGSVSGTTELKVFFHHVFQLLLQLNQVNG
jgi:hypothetical protein